MCRKKLPLENSHSINKITPIQINFLTLTLDFIITVHITTYKCRQTIAEVQLSHRVNWDTRQMHERKIQCQAKNVKLQTPAFQKKHSSGGLGRVHLPEMLKKNHSSQNISWRHFAFSFFLCLRYFILIQQNNFLSDPTHQLFKVSSRELKETLSRGSQSVASPQGTQGSYTAGGSVAAGGGGGVTLETIRHENTRPAGMSWASVCRRVAEMWHK